MLEPLVEFEEICKSFRTMIRNHDFYYQYCDDFSVYERGRKQLDNIKVFGKQLPVDIANEIWIDVISTKYNVIPNKIFY